MTISLDKYIQTFKTSRYQNACLMCVIIKWTVD